VLSLTSKPHSEKVILMYYTVKEASKKFGLHPRMIYREIEARRLKALVVGEKNSKRPTYRIADAALQAWEAAQTIGQQ
jgi:excisionase family DNA binding protein